MKLLFRPKPSGSSHEFPLNLMPANTMIVEQEEEQTGYWRKVEPKRTTVGFVYTSHPSEPELLVMSQNAVFSFHQLKEMMKTYRELFPDSVKPSSAQVECQLDGMDQYLNNLHEQNLAHMKSGWDGSVNC